jgi:hypothetical protein
MGATKSLFLSARQEAERHKYFASQRAGRDLGLQAIDEWHQRHWTLWLRHRWLEHLMGVQSYEEFPPERFGVLARRFGPSELLDAVIRRVRGGAENIDILVWAARERHDLARVTGILTEMRINEIRCTRFCFTFADYRPS